MVKYESHVKYVQCQSFIAADGKKGKTAEWTDEKELKQHVIKITNTFDHFATVVWKQVLKKKKKGTRNVFFKFGMCWMYTGEHYF